MGASSSIQGSANVKGRPFHVAVDQRQRAWAKVGSRNFS